VSLMLSGVPRHDAQHQPTVRHSHVLLSNFGTPNGNVRLVQLKSYEPVSSTFETSLRGILRVVNQKFG